MAKILVVDDRAINRQFLMTLLPYDGHQALEAADGWSLALLEDCADKLDTQGKERLGFVRSETQRMEQLIDDLLRLSRVSRGEIAREVVDLSALAQSVADELRRREPGRSVEFVVAPDLTVHGDIRLLRIALQNLIGNAWKFTGRRRDARIEFGSASNAQPSTLNPQLVFFIRDNGAGFDMAYATKLFAPFQRMHKSSEFPGTGVGLATLQRIVHRHGGKVWAEAEVNEGATFYFTLSARKEKA